MTKSIIHTRSGSVVGTERKRRTSVSNNVQAANIYSNNAQCTPPHHPPSEAGLNLDMVANAINPEGAAGFMSRKLANNSNGSTPRQSNSYSNPAAASNNANQRLHCISAGEDSMDIEEPSALNDLSYNIPQPSFTFGHSQAVVAATQMHVSGQLANRSEQQFATPFLNSQYLMQQQQQEMAFQNGSNSTSRSNSPNDLFSPHAVKPQHNYNLRPRTQPKIVKQLASPSRRNSKQQAQPLLAFHTHENSHMANEIHQDELAKALELQKQMCIVNPFDPNDLDTEEALESYALIQKLHGFCKPNDVQLPQPPAFQQQIAYDNYHGLKTLVLDLDETLVHCTTELGQAQGSEFCFDVSYQKQIFKVYVKVRPFMYDFLREMCKYYRVVVFTASQQLYADTLLNVLNERTGNAISHRLFRDSCVNVAGTYVKDLRILNPNPDNIIIVDNAIEAFAYQPNNGIPIRSWYEDVHDRQLVYLAEFLKQKSVLESKSVSETLKNVFGIEERINKIDLSEFY